MSEEKTDPLESAAELESTCRILAFLALEGTLIRLAGQGMRQAPVMDKLRETMNRVWLHILTDADKMTIMGPPVREAIVRLTQPRPEIVELFLSTVVRNQRYKGLQSCPHNSCVMGRRGDDEDGETVSVCRECGVTSHTQRERNPFEERMAWEWLPPCQSCGLKFSTLNPYSGSCKTMHEERCTK